MPRGAAHAQIHRLFAVGTTASLPEGKLLDRFLDDGDEAAFEAIVAAHGPMVLGVCRGMLADPHSADDAFQATFLILVKKARSIARRDLLGPWLHGVAHKVASRSRSKSYRQKTSSTLDESHDIPAADDLDRRERARLLHEELAALPAKYRSPVVLCHLEGLTHDEAASRLGWPVGTVRGRLSRARDQLRVRLTRRGAAPAIGAIVATIAAESRAAVPTLLMNQTLRLALQHATARSGATLAATAALTLSREVSMSMLFTPAKLAASGLMAATLATGAAVWAFQTDGPAARAASAADPVAATKTTVDPARPKLAADLPVLPLDPTDAFTRSTNSRPVVDLSGRDGSGLVNVHSGVSTLDTKQYLAKTRNEVDAGLAVLTQQVSELESRLASARIGMSRLKAVKEALEAQPDDRGNMPTRAVPASLPSAVPVTGMQPVTRMQPVASMQPFTTMQPIESEPIRPRTPILPPSPEAMPPAPAREEMPLPPAGTDVMPPLEATVVMPSPIIGHASAPSTMHPVEPGQKIRLEVLEALTARPLRGVRTVRTDGTVNLEYYGELYVAGLNRVQIKEKLITHMRKFLNDSVLGLVEPDPANPRKMRPASGGIEMNDRVYVDDQPGHENVADARRVEELERKFDDLFQMMSAQKTTEPTPRPQPVAAPALPPAFRR